MKNVNASLIIRLLFGFSLLSLLISCGGSGGGSGDSGDSLLEPPPKQSGLAVFVETEDGLNIGAINGETSTHGVIVLKDDENILTDIDIVTTNRWIDLVETDGGPFLVIDGSQDWEDARSPVTVIATNRDNGLSARTEIVVSLLDTELVASGTLGSRGGVVQTNGGAFGVRIPQGELIRSLGVEIWAAPSPSGQTHLRIQFDRDVSTESGRMSLFSNLSAFADSSTTIRASTNRLETSRSLDGMLWPKKGIHAGLTAASSVSATDTVVQSSPGWFVNTNGTRIRNLDLPIRDMLYSCGERYRPTILCIAYDPKAATLNALTSPPRELDQSDGAQPVLFIHGYKKGGALGGGEGYWGNFPELVTQLSDPAGRAFIPYEFRWRTNAAFSVVADDLATAITKLYSIHEKPVRIIAHSMGGLLVRTLAQGLAERHPEFQTAFVGSILTLGTPHSGIFDGVTTVNGIHFPRGQDQKVFKFCGQMSCRQAGEPVFFGSEIVRLANGGEVGGLMAALASTPFSDSIPMVVGIGLKREGGLPRYGVQFRWYDGGDGLITFEGQRYHPSLNRDPLRSCENETGKRISEIVLGAFNSLGEYDREARPGAEVLNNAFGYAHSAPGIGKNTPNKAIELSQAYIECDKAVGCDHASLGLFRAMMEFPEDFCDVPGPTPVATLAGARVTVTNHYPSSGLIATVPYEAVIDSGIEIPAGLLQEIETYSNRLIPADIDIGARTIDIQYLGSATVDNTSFNGVVFDFESDAPSIVGASLDPNSTFTESEVTVTFGPQRVKINMSGIRVNSSSRILVNLQFEEEG